jgi:hypothetical protein
VSDSTSPADEPTPCAADLEQAISAVLSGAIWDGFNGPTGVTKDEALDYAATLARFTRGVLDEQKKRPRDRLQAAFGERTVAGALCTLIQHPDRYGPGSDLVHISYLRILLSAVDDLEAERAR